LTVGVRFPTEVRDFSLFHVVQTCSGADAASYQMGTRALSLGVKWPGREADYSPPSSTKVKNGGTVYPVPHMTSWRGV
jgi:hypothetical protein